MNLKVYDPQDFPPYLPKLSSLYDELFSSGKGFRGLLIQRISKYLNLSARQVHLLSQTIEFVHNASLLHDDLVDRSHLRRNKPTAWLKYSPEYAVLAGDYLLARVMVNLSKHGNLRLIQLTSEVISQLLEGEWMQDSLIRDWNVPLEALDRVHDLKTASLFKWCLTAPFICKEIYNEDILAELNDAATLLGVLFQRSDDLLDFDVRNYEKKAVLGDLKSGYLNSFGVFITASLPEAFKRQLLAVTEMHEFKKLYGEDDFTAKLHEFDDLNRLLLERYNHHLQNLSKYLNEAEKALVPDLAEIGRYLYWRK